MSVAGHRGRDTGNVELSLGNGNVLVSGDACRAQGEGAGP